jgi:hypothetical protein
MARPIWARRPRLALTGVSMSLAGLLALVALTGSGPVSPAMTRAGAGSRASMVAVRTWPRATAQPVRTVAAQPEGLSV